MIQLNNVMRPIPERHIDVANINHLRKLVYLNNNLLQYYNIPYMEVIVYNGKPPYNVKESVVWFESTRKVSPDAMLWATPIIDIITKYFATGILNKDDMRTANHVWDWLKTKIQTVSLSQDDILNKLC